MMDETCVHGRPRPLVSREPVKEQVFVHHLGGAPYTGRGQKLPVRQLRSLPHLWWLGTSLPSAILGGEIAREVDYSTGTLEFK